MGAKASKPTFCPVQYATGGILNLAVIFVKLLAQNFLEIFGWALLSLKMMVKQNGSPHLLSSGHHFSLSVQVQRLGQVYATGAELRRLSAGRRFGRSEVRAN
jgi:hypothetical protein